VEDTQAERLELNMNKQMGVYIPARLSSERLPRKLLLPMGDTCLFEIACKKLNELPSHINKYALIYDEELIEIANKYENIKIVKRSEASAKAETPLSYIFGDMKNVEDTHLMFLNPCLAFLTKETILKALEDFSNSDADYGTSVKPFQNWLMGKDGQMLTDIDYKELTTKKIEQLWQTAHCFHVFNREKFFNDGYMLKDGFMPLPIPEEETIDVDTRDEYEFAKWKYENR
jgi:CMP-N-acetylneuraminic acid synthetase